MHFVSDAETRIGACRGKPIDRPDIVHSVTGGPHGSHVVSACQNIRISRSLTLIIEEQSRSCPVHARLSLPIDRQINRIDLSHLINCHPLYEF